MKLTVLLSVTVLSATTLLAGDAKDEVLSSARKLADANNYSWRTAVAVPEDVQFKPGPIEGKTEKGGPMLLNMTLFANNETKAVLQRGKGAVSGPDGDWKSLEEVSPQRYLGMLLRNFKAPAAEAEQLVGFANNLKKKDDAISADLTDQGAKTMLSWRGGGARVINAKGSVKFWVKDGILAKYEFHVKGTVNFNGNDIDQDRTTTVVIKDVGVTKIEVPEAARKKLS